MTTFCQEGTTAAYIWAAFYRKTCGIGIAHSLLSLLLTDMRFFFFFLIKPDLDEEFYLNLVLFFQRTFISVPLCHDILVVFKDCKAVERMKYANRYPFDSLTIILIFVLPRGFEKFFFVCSVPYSGVIPGPKETGSYNSLS